MDALPEPLTSDEHRRLVEIIGSEAPELLPLARDAVNARWITDEESKALTDVLFGVFLGSLDGDDEPSAEGAEADDLLGRIEMQRERFWR